LTDKYAVIGNPIAHSKSPQIHAAFAKQTGQNISYEPVLAVLDGFAATVHDLITQGYKGVNVTVPFKFDAFAMCDELTERAKAAGAVNTLSFSKKTIIGDNTDGVGLVRDLTLNYSHALQGARILLVGAGGAARGVMLPLIDAKPASILVANRTLDKAQYLTKHFAKNTQCSINACKIAQLKPPFLQQAFDVIINATSTGLNDIALLIGDEAFSSKTLAYDMMYGRETPFMQQARANGAQTVDGLGMLVGQAAEAFYVWRGVRPQTAPVIKMLRPK
jgi:shikimate dehydrogenase